MPKASPMTRSFNAGEFSELLNGRVDLDRYPSSVHSMENYIAAPQGPAVGRSGTAMVATAADESEKSALVPFVFSSEQAMVLEFTHDRIRFLDENGVQTYTPVAALIVSAAGQNLVIEVATSVVMVVGDQVALSGFPDYLGLNGVIANVASLPPPPGGVLHYELDVVPFATPSGAPPLGLTGSSAHVYYVACAYTEAEREGLRFVQSVDVMYLLSNTQRTRKLERYGTYDWRLSDVEYFDGPYLPSPDEDTILFPGGTGNAVPNMTGPATPSGSAGGGSADASHPYWHAFSASDSQYWQSGWNQAGWLSYQFPAVKTCDGYALYIARQNDDTSYVDKDYAPMSWIFQGSPDGVSWATLDEQEDYVLYDNSKSVFFEIANDAAYIAYRIVINKCTRNGPIPPRIRRFVLRDKVASTFSLNASSLNGINNGFGFQPTDVGRLVRIKGGDGAWRQCKITAYASGTSVSVQLLGEPLLDTNAIREWRLGYWSDTTGWPGAGDFFEDRLWLGGSTWYPDLIAGSNTGDYEGFRQTDTFGEVLDDSAIVVRLNSRKLSRVRWLSSDTRGMLIGTGSEEYTLAAPQDEALTARNMRARPTTRRGSADIEPVKVDDQVLYVQRGGRSIREFAFVFESDGYKSPSMTQLASHIGVKEFKEIDYAAEPHSIVWARRADGSLVGLTYNREENVIGWHRHDLSGAEVESVAVIPQADQLQDALWLSVKRTVNGQTRRYIERLTRFWDFDSEIADATFVDSSLRYNGTATDTVYGLRHLEGEEVYGLADGNPIGPLTVADGSVTIPFTASNIVLGLGFDSEVVLPRLNAGAADGTAQGKTKRVHGITLAVWRSHGGEIGVWNEQEEAYLYDPIEYPADFSTFEDVELFTGVLGPIVPAPGYDQEGRIAFRRPKSIPLPFNVVAVMPQLHTQDR